ncbi:hypothetical protein J7337_010816 [Fusarium musae]|uniref:Uncharacterized protein n=1 Tax=Fusarium musae TaxID=1042133 RepID=A0A9P8D9P7_9HYPO|nr:hypothetical protein J7337_010816 [Fusarium musae]KAG9497940.1 hypothetical protein J7337_010816 [Fusarium musae]
MKYNSAILVLVCSTLISAGTSTISGAEAVCGDLGILQVTPGNIPDGVEPSDLRLCADHPLGRNRTLDPAKGASLAPLEEGDIPNTTPMETLLLRGTLRLFRQVLLEELRFEGERPMVLDRDGWGGWAVG